MSEKTENNIGLPDKPSELIRLALSDLRKCEQSGQYKIYMGAWHIPGEDGLCWVCAAGAVMAQTEGVTTNKCYWPENSPNGRKYLAINALRIGDLVEAFVHLDIRKPAKLPSFIPIRRYHRMNRDGFFTDMESLADLLEKHDL